MTLVRVGRARTGEEPAGPVRRAIAEADDLVSAGALTIGILHGDPHPAAFRVDEHGGVGLLDWDSAVAGPLLYDVASAAMYGGVSPTDPETALLRGYLEEAPTDVAELRHAEVFLRLRFAVQALYFSWRAATGVTTGSEAHGSNGKGLEDAKRGLSRAQR